jgi:hypothetical protein
MPHPLPMLVLRLEPKLPARQHPLLPPNPEPAAASFSFADPHYVGVMRIPLSQSLLLLPLLFVAACSRSDNAGDAGSVSAGETRALDNAAEMLQNQQLPVGAIPAQKTPVVKQVPTKAPPKPAG